MGLEVRYQGISLMELDILKEVILQLNKDLTLSGIEYEFSLGLQKDDFVEELRGWIEKTLIENESILFNFLYRVDVKQELIYTNDGLPHENLLRLILNRELQKVVLKRQFSSGSNSIID